MKFLALILFFGAFPAKASETVSFQNSLYSLTCSKADGACSLSKPSTEKAWVELKPDAHGNQTGSFRREVQVKDFVIGATILISYSKAGYYLMFITSWIQDAGRTLPRLEAHASVTVNSMSELNRINIPSPDMESEFDFGHGQFLFWADKL